MITAQRTHDFSYGHRVNNQGGKCEHLHGHNGRITIVCAAIDSELDDVGRVIDFSVIKEKVCQWVEENWDHKFLVWIDDPWAPALASVDPTTVWVDFNPTAENLAKCLVEEVGPQVLKGTGVEVVQVIFEETRKCSATYTKEGYCV